MLTIKSSRLHSLLLDLENIVSDPSPNEFTSYNELLQFLEQNQSEQFQYLLSKLTEEDLNLISELKRTNYIVTHSGKVVPRKCLRVKKKLI